MNSKWPESSTPRESSRLPVEYTPHTTIAEQSTGDYYYGRTQTNSAVARSYLLLLSRQRWTLVLTFLLVLLPGLLWIFTRPRLYGSTAELLCTRSVATEARLLLDVDLVHEAFARLPEDVRWKGFGTRGTVLAKYPYTVTVPKDTDIVSVEVTAHDPFAAAAFANEIVMTDLEKHAMRVDTLVTQTSQPLDVEIAQCAKDLKTALAEVAQYKHQAGITDIQTQVTSNAQGLVNLQLQINDEEREVARQKSLRELLERQLKGIPSEIVNKVDNQNALVMTIDAEVERLQQQRASLLQEYQENTPEIRAVDEQLAAARRRRAEAITGHQDTVSKNRNPLYDNLNQSHVNAMIAEQDAIRRLTVTRTQLDTMRRNISNLPDTERQMAFLSSHVEELRAKLYDLAGQKRSLNMNTYTELPGVAPTMRAKPDLKPVSPRYKTSLLLLAVVAFTAAIGLAMLRAQFDDRLHSGDMLEELSGQRLLASLPHVRNGFRGLVTSADCPPTLLESFRILRANVMLALRDPMTRVITVTSAHAGEGKSTTVVNLAAMIATSGKRVLVIDCDLRHPSVHLYYGIENRVGLTSVLLEKEDIDKCIQQVHGENLHVLTAGPIPGNSPELLASPEMALLLNEMKERFDCVLLDSPPLLNLSDGVLLASLAQGAVLVVSFERTRQSHLYEATRVLNYSGVPIIGIVNNHSSEEPTSHWLTAIG